MKEINIKDALQIAINEEIKAYQLYKNTSEKVSDPGTKKMLLELADQEMGHRELLESIINNQKYEVLGQHIPQNSPGITEFLITSELHKHASPQDAMVFAMKEEEKAFRFYSDLKKHYVGTELEKIFTRLAAEEQGHKRKLEIEYEEHFLQGN